MQLGLLAAQKFIRTLANSQGLSVVYEYVDAPRTNGRTVYLPAPDPNWSDDEMALWEHSVYHELGHNVPEMRDCFLIAKDKEIDMESFFGTLLNLVDDHRQERHKIDEYEGRKAAISKGNRLRSQEVINNWSTMDQPPDKDYHSNLIRALFAWDRGLKSEWLNGQEGIHTQAMEMLNEKQQGMYDKLEKLSDELRNVRTAEDEYNLVKKIIDETGGDSEEEEKKSNESYQSKRDGNEEGEKSGEEGQSEGSEGEEQQRRDQEAWVKYKDLNFDHHTENGPSQSPLHIEYNLDYHGGTYIPYTEDEYNIHDYEKGGTSSSGAGLFRGLNLSGMAAQVRKLLIIRSRSTYDYGQKRGRLHAKNVYRTCMRRK